ncbi:MAG: sulfurtransferase-like selenium metabolism protein YedF [Symbiobacteriaceae bacterium]|nr:sulfurtransferase-like selenium metabolism protein YedF [Symbiobacteriaceae bacterium]
MASIIIDNRGLPCPQPVINTQKALAVLEQEELTSLVDNLPAKENLIRLATSLGYSYSVREDPDLFAVTISKSVNATLTLPSEPELFPHATTDDQNLVVATRRLILITGTGWAQGPPELSQALLKSLLYTIIQEPTDLPAYLVLLNSGVTLLTAVSPLLPSLQTLASLGVEILACGICTNYYHIDLPLAVGRVSNMYEIYGLLSKHTVLTI